MDDGLRTQRFCLAHRLRERVGAVVAVGDDAELHDCAQPVSVACEDLSILCALDMVNAGMLA